MEIQATRNEFRIGVFERTAAEASMVIPPGTALCYDTTAPVCVADRVAAGQPPEPGAPSITDLAAFLVTPPIARSQPNGWAKIAAPTNFYADGGVQVLQGTLLGKAASVRFTPVAWYWDYGDGVVASLGTSGRRWPDGKEFFPTATSHVYEEKGDFTVRLVVDYFAEYQYGRSPWRSIRGALRIPANELSILSWYVETRLVAYDCIEDPGGFGCTPQR